MKTTATQERKQSANDRAEPMNGSISGANDTLDLIVERVWLYVRRRAAWLQSLGIGVDSAANRPVPTDPDDPDAELDWCRTTETGQSWGTAIAGIEQRLAGDSGAWLARLATTFGLNEPDLDLLQVCLAAQLDPALGPAFAHVTGSPGRTFVTDALVRQLHGYGRLPIMDPVGPLAVWNLVRSAPAIPGDPEPLAADPVVAGWLHGSLAVGDKLGSVLQRIAPRDPLDNWPIEPLIAMLRRNIDGETRLRIIIEGVPGAGRSTLASIAAARLNCDCFGVDADDIADEDWPDVFLEAQRLALFGGIGLVWRGEALERRRWQSRLVAAPMQFVVCEPGRNLPLCPTWIDTRIPLPDPTIEERRRLWNLASPKSQTWDESGMTQLTERYALTPGEILSVAGRGVSTAVEAAELARDTSRHRLDNLGTILECPFTWDDLVLPESLNQVLQDFAFEAHERARFWEQPDARRLFPRGTGLTALFHGPSGTGKTMAAQVVAAELGLDLVCIDMARVVSKYIGETAKHLSRIFSRADRMSAVLLFDEADALFAKRTDVKDSHDRYANTDTSYLLQLLEAFQGIAILTTNKKGNIDPAFVRRIRYIYDFPQPEGPERRRIWGSVVRTLAGAEDEQRLSTTLDSLANGTPASGAQIKNAVLASVFIARRGRESLSGEHLVAGLNRELGKEGRCVGTRERARLQNNTSGRRQES